MLMITNSYIQYSYNITITFMKYVIMNERSFILLFMNEASFILLLVIVINYIGYPSCHLKVTGG